MTANSFCWFAVTFGNEFAALQTRVRSNAISFDDLIPNVQALLRVSH